MKSGEWDWAGEEREYKKAIQLNANLADAHMQYGDLLAAKGELEKAIAETRLAQQLDPLNAHVNAQVGNKLALARRYDEAEQELRKTMEMDPTFSQTPAILAGIYFHKGMFREAIDEEEKAMTLSGEPAEVIAKNINAVREGIKAGGIKGYWEKKLEISLDYENPFPPEVALAYAQLGQKDLAFQWLEKAYERRLYWLIFGFYIKSEPRWDPIRSDPRYTDLLRRCHLL